MAEELPQLFAEVRRERRKAKDELLEILAREAAGLGEALGGSDDEPLVGAESETVVTRIAET